jgi:hypothetical protein
MSEPKLRLPSSDLITVIEVFYQAGDPPFICGVSGHMTYDMFDKIEAQLEAEELELLTSGDGTYLFRPWWQNAEYENGGLVDGGYWNLEQLLFKPL